MLVCSFLGSCHYDKYDTLIKPGLHVDTSGVPAIPSYANHIVPIMVANCYSCHDAANYSGNGKGFRLDTYSGLHSYCTPADSNATIVGCITYSPKFPPTLYMPNNGNKLSPKDIAIFVKWVFQGAPEN